MTFDPFDDARAEADEHAQRPKFAAVREVDTTRPRRSEIARMMSERPRCKAT
jgi:hypothetical protein